MRYQPKDVWEYADRLLWGGKETVEDDPELRMSSKKFKGHLRVMKQKLPPQMAGNREADKMQRIVVAAAAEICPRQA